MKGLTAIMAAAACTNLSMAYRIKGSEDENKPFVPYERGFVQNVQDPATASHTRANQGYARSALLGDSVGENRLFSCPQMVGPLDDQRHYCRSREHGYCDRRSGICFCNEGYAGESCGECAPTHFGAGGHCQPKRLCPGDCSGAGRCDYVTGTCECNDHRDGDDCSKSRCSRFHHFCTHCDDGGCIECEGGFSVHADAGHGSQCEPCWRFDPRCRDCNAEACTSCVDLLLLSIRRSGRRPQDPPLPPDELTRELSVTVPFGSQQDDAFYDAEHYFLVDPTLVPLNESAVECHQGINFDDSITCAPYDMTSHIMCGNYGTITFGSPEYAIREDGKQIRLTLQRSGGGVGEVTVSYSIYPITAGYEDVTSTAFYTANQTIVFRHGQIKASFLLTINDDRLMEADETFSVHLSRPTGGARLGTQSRTIVTIIDDDEQKTCSNETTLGHARRDLGSAEAGVLFQFNVFAMKCSGSRQEIGGDEMKVEARKVGSDMVPHGIDAPLTAGNCYDVGDGTYTCDVNVTVSGNYEVDVYQLVPGGLRGYYYTNSYLSNGRLDITRTDAVVNFTWGTGAVTTFGRDYVSVRWEGYVRPSHSETYTFWLDIDDHARLWVDGILLIDSWVFSPASSLLHAKCDLFSFETHTLVLEYRELVGRATARLLWSSKSTPLAAIPSSSLLYKEHIRNSPFLLRVLPSSPSARESRAFGEGLYKGIAGDLHSFTIDPIDRFGNFRGWPLRDAILEDVRHLDPFQATAELVDDDGSGLGNSLIPAIISYNDNTRKYEASYVPRSAGVYRLSVTLPAVEGEGDNHHIFGSPFFVLTKPGATFAPESIAFGGYGNCLPWIATPCPGIYHGMAGQNSTFTIQAFDLNRNRRDTGGDDWKVVALSSLKLNEYHAGIVEEDHNNGTYTVTVAPLVSGPNNLVISLNGSPLRGSPFRMDVVHGPAVGTSSYSVEEDGIHEMTAMAENSMLVQATDQWSNNAIYCSNYPYDTSVLVEGEYFDSNKTLVDYVGGGRYRIHVTPLKSGHLDLSIKINGSELKRSPFNVTVHPGTFSASSSSASGTGTKQATAGEEAIFSIQSMDKGYNTKVLDEASFDIQLVLIERSAAPIAGLNVSDDEVVVTGDYHFMGNGQYKATYTCFITGQYLLHVRDDSGVEISGSPYRVDVGPAEMSAPHSLVDGQGLVSGVAGELAEVRVYGRDRFLNFVGHAIEKLEMEIVLRSRHESDWEEGELSNHTTKQLARDSGQGTFVLDYIPNFSGEYDLSIETFSPGGLEGSYYSSIDLSPDVFISKTLDRAVEKYWEDDPISETIGTQTHFGAAWNGKLASDHDEIYTIAVECNDGGQASLAIDGDYVPWQSCYPMMATRTVLKANEAVHFSVRYRTLEGNAFIRLKWSSPSVPMERIPSRNLYHQVNVGEGNHSPVIFPSKVYAPQSIAIGDSLRNAISGIEQVFCVESRDGFGAQGRMVGNLLLGGGSVVGVHSFHYKEGSPFMTQSVVDNNNGTHTVKYTPGVSGVYFLSVTIGGSDIKESPFLLGVEPGETHPSKTAVVGYDALEGIKGVTGREIHLGLQARDDYGNNRNKGGDELILAMIPSFIKEPEETIKCESEYAQDGIYSIICPPASIAGRYSLHVEILTSSGTKPISNSPFKVTIYPGHATAEMTEVTSGGSITPQFGGVTVKFTNKAGTLGSFLVTAKDLFGNALKTGGEKFVARVRGDTNMDSSEKRLEVFDQENGNYVIVFRVGHPSTYEIDVSMVTGPGLLGEYYLNETSFKEGLPGKLLVDEQINFNIRRLPDDSVLSNIRWFGYISFPHAGIFQFEASRVEGNCKLWIGDTVVLDSSEESAFGSFDATENILYEIKIEYYLDINRLLLELSWWSRKIRKQTVPRNHLFSSIGPIRGSPFHLTVTE